MKRIGLLLCFIFIFTPVIQAQEQVEEMSSSKYKHRFGIIAPGGYAESLNYRSLNYIGQGFVQSNCQGANYDGYSGLVYFPIVDLYYVWNSTNNNLTVNWVDYGNEYRVLLTTAKDETNIVPWDDSRTITLNSDVSNYIFKNVPDSKYLYFHIQAKDKIPGSDVFNRSGTFHHKVISKQMLVLKYFEEEFITYDVLNRGRWRRKGVWNINSNPVLNEFYLTNSGQGIEKIYIEKNTPNWKKYEYTVKLKKLDSNNTNISIIFKMQDIEHYYMFKILNDKVQIVKNTGEIIKERNSSINLNNLTEFKIRIRYDENSGSSYLQVYKSESKIFDMLYNFPIYGGIGIETEECKVLVKKISVKPVN